MFTLDFKFRYFIIGDIYGYLCDTMYIYAMHFLTLDKLDLFSSIFHINNYFRRHHFKFQVYFQFSLRY